MKFKKTLLLIPLFLLLTSPILAASSTFFERASHEYKEICNKPEVRWDFVMTCYVFDKVHELEARLNTTDQKVTTLENKTANQKVIFDVQQVRGSLWTTSDTNPNGIKTPDEVTVNCPKACLLWVNYDVDTRNTNGSIAQSSWPQHLYHIYVDGINQAIFNQASMIVANAAIPLAVNGVIPVSAGQHTVTIYARTTGGTLEQHESHLQVMAIEGTQSNIPTPSPTPIPSPSTTITVNSGVAFDVPVGFKSMTMKLKNVSNLPAWAPTVSFDGTTFHEQHRFGGSQLEVTIPILANKYRLNKGGPDDFTADVTFNPESDAQVLTLGQLVNYTFTSQSFDTTGFNTITITVGGGSNPQNLQAISLQRLESGIYVEKQRLNCDGGAQCPLQSLPVLGGTYRVVLEGNGSAAVLGAILRK